MRISSNIKSDFSKLCIIISTLVKNNIPHQIIHLNRICLRLLLIRNGTSLYFSNSLTHNLETETYQSNQTEHSNYNHIKSKHNVWGIKNSKLIFSCMWSFHDSCFACGWLMIGLRIGIHNYIYMYCHLCCLGSLRFWSSL